MNRLVLLVSLLYILHQGHATPSYTTAHYSGSSAPVGYHGPLAAPVVLASGHIADTPEVTAAKNLHFSALHEAKAAAAAWQGYSGAGDDGSYGSGRGYSSSYGAGWSNKAYSGPLAYPKVLPSGQLADTEEVAAARHAHWNAVAITAGEHAQKWANNYYH